MYLRLDRCAGPACPRCGCTDSEILQRPPEVAAGQPSFAIADPQKAAAWARSSWWQSGKARCNHCRNVFSFSESDASGGSVAPTGDTVDKASACESPAGATRKITECPNCGCGKYYADRTVGEVQYRKCRGCKHRGKTPTPVG